MTGAPGPNARGISNEDPHRVIKAFVAEHAEVIGHDHSVFATARIARDVTARTGVRSLTWEQQIDGVPVHRGTLNAHVTALGELVAIGSEMLARPEAAADPIQRQNLVQPAGPPVSPQRAFALAAANLGFVVDASQITQAMAPDGVERIQKLKAPGWESVRLALSWLPMNPTSVRLCWRTWLRDPERQFDYEIFVDATSGEVVWRRCVTENASAPATYRVFTTESPTPLSPGYSTPRTNQPALVSRTLLTLTSLNVTASPEGWIPVGTNDLRGNNVDAFYYKPVSENSWVGKHVTSNPSRVFDFPLDLTASPADRADAATVNAFYWVNFAHDRFYALGFDELNRNCQENNFGRGGVEGDPISLQVNDPSSDDNAGMTTYPEVPNGLNPKMSLGIYSGPEPDREAALDAEIILHEYGHAVSNRLIGDGSGIDQDAVQSRGMGEGWSDFYAMALTSSAADNLNGNYAKAAYCSLRLWGSDYQANYYSGVRRFPYTTDMEKNPLTFKDIDPDIADPHFGVPGNPVLVGSNPGEVHNVGEVWCSILWEVRAQLIQKHGFATGNQLALQLVTDGLNYCPNNPSFTTARNAILLADSARTGSANRQELWAAFARRGLGLGAVAPGSSTTTGVIESFDSLDALNVQPGSGISVAGPEGGPFKPLGRAYTLTNDSSSSFSWRARAEPPLELDATSGTLLAHGTRTVNVSVNAAAAGGLPSGAFSYSVFFTNVSSGTVLTRVFSIAVGLRQVPTEYFSASDHVNDLANRALWFEPETNGANYSVCRQVPAPATFPINPAAGQGLDLSNAPAVVVTLANGAKFPFFGRLESELEIRRDGSIGPGAVEAPFYTYIGLFSHFATPRISVLRQSYDPDYGRVSWQQLSDQIVVTWENIRDYDDHTASFQAQLYLDGRIHLTFLASTVPKGVCGLSPGGGPPALFVETDLSASPSCSEPPLLLKVAPEGTEGSSASLQGLVTLPGSSIHPALSIILSSSDPSEVTVPPSVVIPFGATSATFPITIVDDNIRDGTQVAFITALRSGYTSVSSSIAVHDNETAILTLSLPPSIGEGAGPLNGTLSMNLPAGGLVGIRLQSSRPGDLIVPPIVFVEPNQTQVQFPITAGDNNRIEGPVPATVAATVQNWTGSQDTVQMMDNESTNLMLLTFLFQDEGAGTVTNGSTVQISGVLATNLPVFLISDDESEIRTPLFGSIIPAGSTNVVFPLFLQDDAVIDGLVGVSLRVMAGGFGPATNYVFVFDNDGPPEPYDPSPSHQAVEVDPQTDLRWGPVEGELLANGDFETGDLAGWKLESTGAGSFVVSDGGYDPNSPDNALPPLSGNFSALTDQTGVGRQSLFQDAFLPDGATNVTLSWRDSIRNHAAAFGPTHGFRVELRDTNNVVLTTLYSTPTNLPAVSGPTNRVYDLRPWRGRIVRVAFVEQDNGGFLNVHLDDVHLTARSAASTFFDVYFGTEAAPASAEFQGATTNHFWSLPPLLPNTTYYWQLKTRRNAVTNAGPIWQFTTRGTAFASVLLASNVSWRVLNTGVYPGSTWNDPGFNDSGWPTGLAKLGFGGDGENSVIGDPADGIVTFAFRRTFTVSHPEATLGLIARMIRDDGAAVYLNGTRVWTDNLPARFAWTDQALLALSDPEEKQWITNTFSSSLLVTGQNLIAVEVHQRHGTLAPSPDLGFAFELRGIYDIANHLPSVVLAKPADFQRVQLPGNLALAAEAGDTDTFGNPMAVLRVEFYADGSKIGEDAAPPYTLTWTNPPPGQHTLTAVVADLAGITSTSAPVHVLISPPAGQNLAFIIPAGANWFYQDSGIYPGHNWTEPGYADGRSAGWKAGRAQLGYGDGDEATEVGYGRNQFARHVTTWFRHHFTPAVDLNGLKLRLLRDDGVVVYLNGTEICRNNMPGGPIVSNTLAASTISGAAENAWIEVPLSSAVLSLLKQGDNVIAAEVHQASTSSPDLSFDLELVGVGNLLPSVSLTSPANNTAVLASLGSVSVALAANASDDYGAVASVQFFRNGILIGADSIAPYEITWENPPVGVHALTALATDSFGATRLSAPVTLAVVPPVSLTARSVGVNAVELAWPVPAEGYRLEVAPALTEPMAWGPSTNAVTQANGQFRVLVDVVESPQFFRLKAP